MAINDFIISTLNVIDDMIFSIDTHKSSDKLHIIIKLNETHSTCPCYGGYTKIKDYSSYSYNHLDVAGIPSVIDWMRRRYVCKECGKSFSEPSPFGPENFHQLYAVLQCDCLGSTQCSYDIQGYCTQIPRIRHYRKNVCR